MEIFLLSCSRKVPLYSVPVLHFQGPLSQPSRRRACVWHPRFLLGPLQLFEISCMGQHTPVHPYHHARGACRRDLSGVRGYFVIMVFQKSYDCEIETCHSPNPTAICQEPHVQGLGLPWGWRGGAEGASRRNGRHTVGRKDHLVG